MPATDHLGLTKEQVRRIVLSKLKVVYHDWSRADAPFSGRDVRGGSRRGERARILKPPSSRGSWADC
jgi:hypothetical protein